MGILDMFRTAEVVSTPATPAAPVKAGVSDPAVSKPAVVPAVPGTPIVAPTTNIPDPGAPLTVVTPATEANGVVPTSPVEPVIPEDTSPLAPFKDLWEDMPSDPNNPDPSPTSFTLNPADVEKAVAKADFSSAITPEHLTAIGEGGEAAKVAFSEALNAVAKQVLTQATLVSNKLAENMVEKALAIQAEKIPGLVRDNVTTSHLNDSNPIFSNPAVKPVIEATKDRLLIKFPDATPAEITKMTNDFILAIGETFAPKAATKSNDPDSYDWNTFLER